ncbi:type II toxin-antitoxin system HicA family toxin [uncultured Olsenella sp.]|uniref:type II toxin-antitoxin system HicA family toxin n=1 Tax=uncultured Olsenella sp. TaxID=190764 RepID=UPI0026DB4426|nr:type II toxin-antitoxin system HicA family toxin [uncultured Olsenella sp.]
MPKEQEVREVIRRLRREGWDDEPGRGSHIVFRRSGWMITVPTAKREIPVGTYRNIAKAAGWI